nr:hypothetical protein Iba_chr13bCG8230 [Ipomoea batatas]
MLQKSHLGLVWKSTRAHYLVSIMTWNTVLIIQRFETCQLYNQSITGIHLH